MEENKTESPAVLPDAASSGSLVRRVLRGVLFVAIWAVLITGAMVLQNARLDQVKPNAPYVDKMFTPETRYAKVLAFGYDMPMADFLYIRAIQAFGGQFNLVKKDFATVFHFFDTIVALDPQFVQAYEFGALVMSEGDHPKEGIDLGYDGWIANPTEYRMPFLNAYTANWTMHDPLYGKKWAMRAIRAKNCPDWVVRWLAYFDRESGRYEAALEFQMRSYLGYLSDSGHDVEMNPSDTRHDVEMQICRMQFEKIAEEWHLDVLNQAVGKYLADHDNVLPADLAALAAAGYLKDYVAMDYPATVDVALSDRMEVMLKEKQKANPSLKYVDLLDEAMKICIHVQSGVPVGPPENRRPNPYVLRHDMKPEIYAKAVKNKALVTTMSEVHNNILSTLNVTIRPALQGYLQVKGTYPKTLNDLFPEGGCPGEPVASHWDYDSETGTVRSPTFPNL